MNELSVPLPMHAIISLGCTHYTFSKLQQMKNITS